MHKKYMQGSINFPNNYMKSLYFVWFFPFFVSRMYLAFLKALQSCK